MSDVKNKIFKTDAKQVVDTLFENKVFRDDLTRDDLNCIEEMVSFMMDSRFESYKKAHQLKLKIEKYNEDSST